MLHNADNVNIYTIRNGIGFSFNGPIQKMIKQSADAAQQFSSGGREDLADKEKAGIAILQGYLPEQLSEDEIASLIQQAIAETGANSMKDMGKVMGILKSRTQGRADMGAVSSNIKSILS